jgi:hypothetical protein
MLFCVLGLHAQTDYTLSITNPSFEQGMTGWTYKSMNTQGNNVFTLKDGSTYVEKWTGRGGAVGSGFVNQQLSSLPPGNYELTVAAQNIQEDSPNDLQTGAYIFAGSDKTLVTVRDTYKVNFNYISGKLTIGFEAINASGNWLALDHFRLTQVGTDLSQPLSEAITAAETLYGDGTGQQANQLKTALDAARLVAANAQATGQEQADAIIALNKAQDIFLHANASADHPLDMTDRITNPSFETGDLTGWTATNMGTMNNDFFTAMKGTWYVELWTWAGNTAGNARLSQKLTDMPAGRYRLKAGAQNYQENAPQTAQTGAWIFAGSNTQTVTSAADYTLEFVQVADAFEIGYEAKGATGNWLSVDNFRLEYIGDCFDDVKIAFAALIDKAEELAGKRMNSAALQALTEAIATAKPMLSQSDAEGWPAAASTLEAAYATADTSQKIFARLLEAINTAQEELDNSQAALTTEYQTAINDAQTVYDGETTTDVQAEDAITALAEASFSFKILNGTSSGTPPTVVTDTRYIRGCTWAFGRSTVTGSGIIEEGFCWSEQPDPKVTDNRTKEYINQAGKIYWLRNLKPATVYYMRAYAINKDYAVGYGEVIKFVTVPKGTVGHWYNNGGDEATNDRINYAINLSMDYYWNNLTSIHGFGISVTYSPGTPTADCGYGGGMRVGESSSYQQPGTIMHEAFHGIGVGTHGMWWNGEMRSAGNRGDWLGDRVTEAVRFWDNSSTAVITGDDMHLWPYGCNGAHEDTHSDNLYCMMGILAQALNEDGLPGSGEIGYALPYYSFNHEDDVKYYIKNEDANRGLRTAYLVETANHQLQWKTMSADEAFADDAAAWYLSFTPDNQYYQLRNAATGYYMTYSSGFKTAAGSVSAANNFHLMRGRVDVEGHRGYYIIHPESSANPPVLVANASGKTGSTSWNIAKSATTQRWLILTAKEAENLDNGNLDESMKELEKMLAQIRKLAQTPHTENVEGADNLLDQQLNSIEQQAKTCTKGKDVDQLTTQTLEAGMTFLACVSATDIDNPFDLTFLLANPDFDSSATTGWTTNNDALGYDAQCVEYYEKTFNFYQQLTQMPAGFYQMRANAFQRPGSADKVFDPYQAGTAKVTTSLYINSTTAPVCHICDDRQPQALFNDGGWGSDQKMGDDTYIPNCMVGAAKYFANGLYDCGVTAELPSTTSTLRVGLKCTKSSTAYWTIFDHFRLFFYGQNRTMGIDDAKPDQSQQAGHIFDLSGRRIAPSTHLKHGLYIIQGKKVVR